MTQPRQWLRLSLGLGITLVFVWLLLRSVDPVTIAMAFALIPGSAWAFGIVFLAAGYALRILRWWLMLQAVDPDLPLDACVWPFLSSIAVNNLLPFRAGDVWRVVGFRHQLGAPRMRILGTLLIERLLDLMSLLGFFFVGLSLLPESRFPDTIIVMATWLAGLGAISLLLLVVLSPYLIALMGKLSGSRLVAGSWLAKVIDIHGTHLVSAFVALRSPIHALLLVACSIACWTCEGAIFVIFAAASGTSLDHFAGWFAMSLGTLATLLPSSPGYLGTFDYFTMQGFIAFGAPEAQAAAVAIAVHLMLWFPLTLLGMGYLASTRFRNSPWTEPKAISTDRSSQ